MKSIERFAELLCCGKVEELRNQLFKLAREFGYEQTLLAILPDPKLPMEAEHAFHQSNYPNGWREKYDTQRFGHIDPTVIHCACKLTPMIWTPETFSGRRQNEMYEEACSYGIRSGVTLPIHGAKGELGMLCFVSDVNPGRNFRRRAAYSLSQLSCLRDFVFESSLQFMRRPEKTQETVHVTGRELECLKWGAAGKSSWEIGYLLNCTEATVNFHFGNIRRKFNATSRQQAIVRAINLGLIGPP